MLLLLFNGGSGLAGPISALVQTAPVASHGRVVQRDAEAGDWRFVLELADPAEGTFATWLDITDFYVGDRHQFGADDPFGDARARLVTVQLQIDNVQAADLDVSIDILAPWGQDTSSLFGVEVILDAGLLMRASMARVVGATTVEWNPLWTGRVESWGDAAEARGQIRTHIVSVVDTFSDLANVLTIIEEAAVTWDAWFDQLFANAEWIFGYDMYGDFSDAGLPQDLNMVAAINRMDQGTDPLGLVWRSLRTGRMVIHPAPWDTTNTDRYPNPLLDVYPDGLVFNYSPDFTEIEYIDDDGQQPFGVSRNTAGVLNTFVVTMPDDEVYPVDDPVSRGKYGARPFQATWILSNPPVVDDLLTARAFASAQALPLRTTLDHEGFWSAMAIVDHLDPVTVVHATSDDGLVVTGTGYVRNVVEERTFRHEDVDGDSSFSWQSTVQIDLTATNTAEALLPVENLAFVGSETSLFGGPSSAEFSWTNPTQPSITPTEVQYRVLGRSLIWTSTSYPGVGADGQLVNWLTPATSYTFQVRLIRRENGVITNASPIRSVNFTTAARILPTPIPGDEDDETDVDLPPFEEECEDVSIELQEQEEVGGAWVTVDTFDGAEIEQDANGNWHLVDDIPNSFFNQGSMYRFLGFCGTQLIVTGTPFDPPDDWTDPCTTPPAISEVPYSSAIVYVPQICAPDTIREYFSGIAGVHGDALAQIASLPLDDPDQRVLVAIDDPEWSDAAGGILAFGECPQTTGVTGDKSISIRTNIPAAEACVLGECGAMILNCVPTSGGWRASVDVYKSGSTITLPTTTELDEGTTYWILATHDLETGDIKILVDGVEDNSVGGTDNVPTINALPIWRVGAPPEAWVTDFAFWDHVVDLDQLTVTINQGSTQADPASVEPIVFDVVFSEEVTGFATGDVTLAGSAGATTGTVINSGDDIHFTVEVTGMTGAGTVIATIASSVCVATVGGAPNAASTSTDNTVTWSPVALIDYTLELESAGPDLTMPVSSGDFLLIANFRRANVNPAQAPKVITGGGFVSLSGVTSIAASAFFDTLGVSRGAARLDRATAAASGTMQSNQDATDSSQVIMRISGLSGAPVQTNRSTADATDSCNISLGSAPTGNVFVVVMFGPATLGTNQQPAAPSGWTKLLDHANAVRGIVAFQADTPEQTFTWSLNSGQTVNGGRDVHILEW